jgi:hypothetical protein
MTKINMSGSNVGAKGLCAVIDSNGNVLPCLATNNGDGTATLSIGGEINTTDVIQTTDTEMLTMNGSAQSISFTSSAYFCILSARLGDIYYAIDDDAVSESGGYIQEGASLPVYLSGVTKLSVIGNSGTFCHYTIHGSVV